MNRDDIDPSLCTGERTLESLDDGFSPPPARSQQDDAQAQQEASDSGSPLTSKSPF